MIAAIRSHGASSTSIASAQGLVETIPPVRVARGAHAPSISANPSRIADRVTKNAA